MLGGKKPTLSSQQTHLQHSEVDIVKKKKNPAELILKISLDIVKRFINRADERSSEELCKVGDFTDRREQEQGSFTGQQSKLVVARGLSL